MTIQHISLWAVIALLVILSATIGLFSLIDKRLGHRIVRTIGTATLQLSLLCALFMLLFHFAHWWSSLLLLVVLMAAAALFRLLQLHLSWKQWLLPLTLSMLAGSVVPIIILLWALTPDVSFWHPRFVLPVIALMAGQCPTNLSWQSASHQGASRVSTVMRSLTYRKHYPQRSSGTASLSTTLAHANGERTPLAHAPHDVLRNDSWRHDTHHVSSRYPADLPFFFHRQHTIDYHPDLSCRPYYMA